MLPDIFQGDINHTVFLEKVSKIREKENYRLVSALEAQGEYIDPAVKRYVRPECTEMLKGY